MALIQKAGRHEVTIRKAEYGQNNTTKTPYFWMEGVNAEGDSIGVWLWLSDKAFERTDKALKEAFDFNGDYSEASIIPQVTNKPCQFVVELEADEKDPKKTYPRVKWVNKAGTVGAVEHSPIDQQADFLAALTRMSGGANAAQTTAATANTEPGPAPDFL